MKGSGEWWWAVGVSGGGVCFVEVMLLLLERTFAAAPSLQAAPAGTWQEGISCTVVVPAYNEADTVGSVVRDFLPLVDEVVVMDNQSSDATASR